MVAFIVTFAAAHAQSKPDFTGTWTLDPTKSESTPGGRGAAGGGGGGRGSGSSQLTIKQTTDQMVIVAGAGQATRMLTYKLDGSESTNEIPGRGGSTVAKSAAKWDGSSLVIETTRDVAGTPITTKEVRTLDSGGQEMVVETTIETPQGPRKRTAVYTKDERFADPCKVNPSLPICGKK